MIEKENEEFKEETGNKEAEMSDTNMEDLDNQTTEETLDVHENAPDEMEKMNAEIADLKDQNLRLYADFENFRKRTAKERIELFSTANSELMEALLPVLDDFKRAMKAQDDSTPDEGVKLIYNKLENTLRNKGLKPMEDTTGKEFDVDTMEAITRIPAPDEKMKGKVIDEVECGYLLGSKILRYAKVVVGE